MLQKIAKIIQQSTPAWLCLIFGFFYFVLDWVFFVTKPSFMQTMTTWEKSQILFNPPLVIIFLTLSYYLSLYLFAAVIQTVKPKGIPLAAAGILNYLPPAALAASQIFILVDNFTYTMWGIGIKTSTSYIRGGYGLFFLLVLGWTFITIQAYSAKITTVQRQLIAGSAVIIIILCNISFIMQIMFSQHRALNVNLLDAPTQRLPNIVIFSSDGVNARNTSVYGYNRPTTPFFEALAKESMLFENTFANCANSSGSIGSMFTGKNPTTTRLIYPPDILKGKDAYEHLPGILRVLGYKSITIGERHYADAFDMNFQYSFDSSTFQEKSQSRFNNPLFKWLDEESAYFLDLVFLRLKHRLLHAFLIKKMPDHYAEITNRKKKLHGDRMRINTFFSFLQQTASPFFAHIHLMGSHGPKYHPIKTHFSQKQQQNKQWMVDFYDDSIISFDDYAQQAYQILKKRNILENTIFIISSDHGNKWRSYERVPLIIRLPHQTQVGRWDTNVQNLSIAPTILDYLNIPIPPWMEATSLLKVDRPPNPIFFTPERGPVRYRRGWWSINPQYFRAPFFSLGVMTAIICNRAYQLDLLKMAMTIKQIKDHTQPCSGETLPKPVVVFHKIKAFLKSKQYDVTSLLAHKLKVY